MLIAAAALAVAALLLPVAPAHSAARATQIGSFTNPMSIAAPPGDVTRLMVLERSGTVRMLRDGAPVEPPFLDIASSVVTQGEQGLLSLAFAPDYPTSRKLYVYYTTQSPRVADSGSDVVIDEFTAGSDDLVDVATRRRLVTIPHPTNTNHNGGTLAFGPDGRLYAFTGDGGSGNDPQNNAQNSASLLGKVLRIDPATATVEVFAIGLRNPFRASFDRATGDMLIGDVGQGRAEEISFLAAGSAPGANFGWRCYEGFQRTGNSCDTLPLAGYVEPMLEQVQPAFRAIIGGYVVRDPGVPDLNGRYLYGDNTNAQLRSAVAGSPRATDDRDVPGLTIAGLSGFGEDNCGHVYATSLSGPVYRIDGDVPPAPCPPGSGVGVLPGGGSAGGGGAGPGGGGAVDTVPPAARITRARSQPVLRDKGFVLRVVCDEACGFLATGNLRIRGDKRVYVLKPVSRLAQPGSSNVVLLRYSKKASKALRTALARGRRANATLTVTARDSAGNSKVTKTSVLARR
jgi:glucose/arabinose dehydrogenase